MATSAQIKTDNNTNIRIKTANNSITADNVADQLDAGIDYTDQQDALKVDKVAGKSLIADTEITRLAGVSNVGATVKTQGSIDAISGSKATLQYDINNVNKGNGSEVKLPTTTEVGKEVLFLASNYSGTVSVYVNDAEDIKLSGGANGISGNQQSLQINANEAYRFIYRTNNYWYFEKIIDIPNNYYQLVSERTTDGTLASNSNFKYPTEQAVKTYVDANVGSTINTAFINKTYLATMSVAYDSANPNFEIDITGNLDLTVTGTTNGDLGLVNLYFSGTQVATLQGFADLVITGATDMIPVYFIHDTDGLKWYKDEVGGATVDTSLFALQNGTTLWHTAVATNVGTFSNTGTACTGTGTAITAEMVGAKIVKANGEVGIITARASNTSFTVTGFTTNSVGTAFVVNCVAYKIGTDGFTNLYDILGVRRLYIESGGTIKVGSTNFQSNSNVTTDATQFSLQGTILLTSDGYTTSPFFRNRIIYTVSTLPIPSAAGVYASVSDALSPTYLGIVAGGGAVVCPVYWNGTNWICH